VTAVLFYFFAALTLASALLVVSRRNPISAALYLVLAFLGLAGIYVLMDATFLAAVQVAVYAGAIMVLFLFVIMLLNLDPREFPPFMTRRVKWVAAVLTAVLGLLLLALDAGHRLPYAAGGALRGDAGAIGDRLFGRFLLPFEITALLLLVAIVGAVVLTRRTR
jgi:NADH-quinone oxidoreductase subunit J